MKRTIFLGQAPAKPGSRHEKSGSYLAKWLASAGLTEQDIELYCKFLALIPFFPGSSKGSHLVPTPQQTLMHREVLREDIANFSPTLLVPVGKLAITEIMGSIKLTGAIGNIYRTNPLGALGKEIDIIPLPHPSGRSSWTHRHPELLQKALKKLEHKIKS